MARGIGRAATRKVITRLTGSAEAGSAVAALVEAGWAGATLRAENVATELMERAGSMAYPTVTIYCEKVANELREKFRAFSGTAQMAIEVRHSQDRLDGLEKALEEQTDAVADALAASRGDWGDGMYYTGAYEVSYARVGRGGKNFIKLAKITFEIGVNRN